MTFMFLQNIYVVNQNKISILSRVEIIFISIYGTDLKKMKIGLNVDIVMKLLKLLS